MSAHYRYQWPIMNALTRFWRQDRGLSIVLALLLVSIFVIPPLLPAGSGRSGLGDIVLSLMLIAGVRALYERPFAQRVLMTVTAITVGVDLASWIVPVPQAWVQVAMLTTLLLLLAIILAQTFRGGPITAHRIMGGVAAYLLLGAIWAEAYNLVENIAPGSFQGVVNVADGPRAWLYFSYSTLTTVGYGEVLPIHPVARSLAMLEAVTGSLYLTILVARLVSLSTSREAERDKGGDRESVSRSNRGQLP